jgi:hypothetical protein
MREVEVFFPTLLKLIGGCRKQEAHNYCDECPLLSYRHICTRSREVSQ